MEEELEGLVLVSLHSSFNDGQSLLIDGDRESRPCLQEQQLSMCVEASSPRLVQEKQNEVQLAQDQLAQDPVAREPEVKLAQSASRARGTRARAIGPRA